MRYDRPCGYLSACAVTSLTSRRCESYDSAISSKLDLHTAGFNSLPYGLAVRSWRNPNEFDFLFKTISSYESYGESDAPCLANIRTRQDSKSTKSSRVSAGTSPRALRPAIPPDAGAGRSMAGYAMHTNEAFPIFELPNATRSISDAVDKRREQCR